MMACLHLVVCVMPLVPKHGVGMVGTGYRVPSVDTPGYRISVLDT